ncbi:3-oxoadipate enol-lactonase [Serratia rubidaea]|uniref:3-oxoadipate enol-lactonase n=1 Tax=Serratia rubidaea TaxID=61652 RepID=A0A448SLC2_SERRU|nr:3-oxoadipate enol-lactonase [Serratia rubidaea]MBH1929717.1 3-oxoadipate enol-lactonase [Serratia rubidaea]MEB7588288.1 3-oxoadipate enol-lactonase [Serratia rubidaea]VEI68548.1 3-oxoadipate enol-lactonase 2 [Serratia rubidaea]
MEIEYRLDGPADAPLLVLSNSLGTTLDLWQPQMALFSAHFRVLRYNQRGHGGTPLPAAPLTLEILGRDVIALLDRLEVERAHFCGISMGGLTGLWLNRYQPQRLRRLVVANSAACIGSAEGWRQRAQQARRDGLAEIAAASPARWFSEEFRRREPQQVATLIARLAQGNAAGYAACCDALALADLRTEVVRMPQPMLAIAGELDPVTTPDDARFLQENAPQAELTTLPASHIANIACPTLFAHRVLDFLTEV